MVQFRSRSPTLVDKKLPEEVRSSASLYKHKQMNFTNSLHTMIKVTRYMDKPKYSVDFGRCAIFLLKKKKRFDLMAKLYNVSLMCLVFHKEKN